MKRRLLGPSWWAASVFFAFTPNTVEAQCDTVTAPWTENFDGPTFVPATHQVNSTFDSCWTTIPTSAHLYYCWWVGTSYTTSNGFLSTGPSDDHTPTGAGRYIHIKALYGGTGDQAEIRTPWIDISGISNPTLRFWKHFYGDDIDSFFVEVNTGSGFQTIYETFGPGPQTDHTDAWAEEVLSLDAFAGSTALQIQFRAIRAKDGGYGNRGELGDLALDDISVGPCLNVHTAVTNITCHGASDGSIDVNVSGGTTPYTYAWSRNPQTGFTDPGTQNLSQLEPGTYTLTVTDTDGCTRSLNLSITEPSALVTSGGETDITCHGVNDGSIDITVSGGTSPYSYLWNNGLSAGTSHSNLSAGTYRLSITDGNQCEAFFSYTITEPDELTATVSAGSVTQLSCSGDNDGLISLTVSGGTSPYSYLWNTGATTSGLSGLTAGVYQVTVTDANNCTHSLPVSITQPGALFVTDVVTSVSCFDGSDGSIDVTVSGGTPGYTYAWDNGLSAGTSHSNLSAGIYRLSVTDANGCTESFSTSITHVTAPWAEDFEGPFSLSNTFDQCWTTIPAASSWGIYSWRWVGTPIVSWPTTGPPVGTGQYIYTNPGPAGSAGDQVEIRTPWINISGLTNPTLRFWKHFYGADIDSFLVEVDAGNGFQTIYATHGPGPQIAKTDPWVEEVLSLNAFAGSTALQIRFRAIRGGGWLRKLALDDISVDEGPSCPKPSAISVDSVGITPNVTVDWVPGSGTSWEVAYGAPGFHPDSAVGSPNGPIGIVSASAHPFTVSGLMANTDYHFYVREACATVPGANSEWRGFASTRTNCGIVAPWTENFEGPTFAVPVTFDPCWTTIPSWIPPIWAAYSWLVETGGTASSSFSGPSVDHTTGLGKYIYTEASWGSAGDTAEIRTPLIDISDIANPALRFWKHFYGTHIDSFFVEVDTGSGFQTIYQTKGEVQTDHTDPWVEEVLSLNAFAGSTALQIRFRAIRGGGWQGDMALDDISVGPCLNVYTTVTNATTCGVSDGSISVSISGGTPPYTYLWNTGGTTSSLNNLSEGTYQLTVTDDGCTQSLSISITQLGVLVATVETTNVTNCGVSDGSISVSISGGTPPYTYLWNTGGTTSSLNNLSEGTYQLTVTDDGCTQSLSVSINVLSAIGGATDITCHGANDGSIDLTISGGTPGYIYAWDNGLSAGTSHSNLSAGTYRLSVTDGNQCEEFFSYTINDPDVLTVLTVTQVSCFDGSDGSIDVTVSGGTPGYTYAWDNGLSAGTSHSNLSAGIYRLSVTDANGCTESFSTSITHVTAPWAEDFEGPFSLNNTFDQCWTTIPAASSWGIYSWRWVGTPIVSWPTTGPPVGTGQYIYTNPGPAGSAGDQVEIRTPWINISGLTNPTLRFWKHFYGADIDSFLVEVDAGNGFQTIYATHGPGPQIAKTDPWVEEVLSLNAFAGSTALQIRFRAIRGGGWLRKLALDDISVDEGPSCPKPSAISVDSVGITPNVTVDWVPGSGTSWEVAYGAPGFHPDSAVGSPNGPIGIVSASAHPFTVSGLMANTDYHFYVREACATVPGANSEWRGFASTRTNCGIVAPWTENFEGPTFAVPVTFDPCWTTIPSWIPPIWAAYSWLVETGGTASSSFSGPSVDHTTGLGKYIYTEASWGSAGDTAEIRTPLIDISGIANPALRFWKHFYGTHIDSFFVEVDTGSGFQTIYQTQGPGPQTASTDPWVEVEVDLNPFSGSTALQIRFRAIRGGDWQGDLALDDISIGSPQPNPSTIPVDSTGVTDTTLDWVPGSGTSREFARSIDVYPNPATREVFVDYDFTSEVDLEVRVINHLGQLVLTTRELNAVSGKLRLDVAEWASGIYNLLFSNGSQSDSRQLVIQK